MPRIIAEHLAHEVGRCRTDAEVSRTVASALETARASGYAGEMAELHDELCELLREMPEAERHLATVRSVWVRANGSRSA